MSWAKSRTFFDPPSIWLSCIDADPVDRNLPP